MVQSKQELRDLLDRARIELRPNLGQNFLIDQNLMHLLVNRANLQPDDTVLEVGAATGSLTELLSEQSGAVVAVEIDRRLMEIAKQKLSGRDNVDLLCRDALFESKLDMTVVLRLTDNLARLGGRLLLVANLPYKLASRLLMECICGELPFSQLYFTVQREVAERILARPGTKSYGLLSVVFQASGRAKRLRKLPPSVFWPKPEVDSAMLAWARASENTPTVLSGRTTVGSSVPLAIDDLITLKEVVKVLLHYRRKKISSCIALKQESPLRITDLNRALAITDIDPNLRGEQLSPEQYVALAQAVNMR